MIKYKVVKPSRRSVIVPWPSEFCLQYNRGQIVKCIPGSIGIMVFRTVDYAQEFAAATTGAGDNNIVIKVKPIGKPKTVPIRIAAFQIDRSNDATSSINKFNAFLSKTKYYTNKYKYDYMIKVNLRINVIPAGTECYPAVEVLE